MASSRVRDAKQRHCPIIRACYRRSATAALAAGLRSSSRRGSAPMLSELLPFVTGPLPGPVLPARYDAGLVVLSYVVASLAAYTAIDLAGRVSEFRTEPRRAAAWLLGGAFAMGAGIWSMHFVAMLAYQLPIPVRYEPWTTFASMVAAIVTSGFALYIVTRGVL